MTRVVNGHEEYQTKRMLDTPITELSRLIGRKWYLSLEKLSAESGCPLYCIYRAVEGKSIKFPRHEQKLRNFLEAL